MACQWPASPSLIVIPSQVAKRGPKIAFRPSSKIFTRTAFDFATIEHRLRDLAFLKSSVSIVLADKRGSELKAVVLHG